MERLPPRVLLFLFLFLLLLGCTAREGSRDTTRLDPYGASLLDGLMQCPAHWNVSGGPSLDRAQTSPMGPGKAGAPPAEETSYPWTLLSGVSAGEISRFSAKESTDSGVLLMEGEQCNKWVGGKANPVETFQCPTQHNQREEMFCCGTCTASYCCSSTKERLDQASCSKIMKKTDDYKAALLAVPPPEKSGNNIRLVLAVIGVSCICVWIAMVVSYLQDQKISLNQQRPGYEQLDVECEHPASRQAASGDPDPSSQWLKSPKDPLESPMAVAISSGGSEQDTAV